MVSCLFASVLIFVFGIYVGKEVQAQKTVEQATPLRVPVGRSKTELLARPPALPLPSPQAAVPVQQPPRCLFWLRPSHLPLRLSDLPPRLSPSHPSQPHHARSMKSRPPDRDAGVSRSRPRPASKPLGRPRNVCANRATAPRSARSFGRAGCGIGFGSVPLVKSWRPRRRSRVSDTRKPLPRPTPFCTESSL